LAVTVFLNFGFYFIIVSFLLLFHFIVCRILILVDSGNTA